MHVRHEKLFLWLKDVFPASRLYGPYDHGGRRYYQWMARGEFLERELVPLVASHFAHLDDYAAERFRSMCERYGLSQMAEGRATGAFNGVAAEESTAPGPRKRTHGKSAQNPRGPSSGAKRTPLG